MRIRDTSIKLKQTFLEDKNQERRNILANFEPSVFFVPEYSKIFLNIKAVF